MENQGRQTLHRGTIAQKDIHALPRVDEEGQAPADGEGKLEFEGYPLPPEVQVVPDALRPVAEEVEASFANEPNPALGRQGGQETGGVIPYSLGMYAETGDSQRESGPQCLRSPELHNVMRHDGAAPVRTWNA